MTRQLMDFGEARNSPSECDGRFAAIILAVGGSPKKGRALPLRVFLGSYVIERAARAALVSGACEVLVVAGEHADEIRSRLRHLQVRVVANAEWREGMASSIRAGVCQLRCDPDAVVLCLGDRHKVTPEHIRALGERAVRSGIVASSYDGILGAPAAFNREHFPELLKLQGNAGARNLIRAAEIAVETIGFAEANERLESEPFAAPLGWVGRISFPTEVFDFCKATRAPPLPVVRRRLAVGGPEPQTVRR